MSPSVTKRAAELHFGDDIAVPTDFATARVALVGMSGAGKSTAFADMAEESYAASIPFTWLDPLGAAWGMQSSADGLGPGLPIPIFGGYHGNLPLRADAGALLAREIYGLGISAILDLSAFDPREQCRFVTEHFLAMIQLHLKAKKVRAIFLDEAATIAPQRASNEDDNASATAVWRMHTGGRAIGLGLKTATQSAAEQDKRTMKQAELFVALRTFSPHDQKPVLDYLRTSVDSARAKEIASTLASLDDGEAWFIAPRWLGEVRRVRFRLRRTFDSSRTPALGETIEPPKALAEVDVERLRVALTRAVESKDDAAKARKTASRPADREDDAELRALRERISQLEDELAEAKAAQRVEVPVLTDDHRREIGEMVEKIKLVSEPMLAAFERAAMAEPAAVSVSASAVEPNRRVARRSGSYVPRAKPNGSLGSGPMHILEVLASRPSTGASRAQLAFLAGYAPAGGTYGTYLSRLRAAGAIEDGGRGLTLTAVGKSMLTSTVSVPIKTKDVIAMFRSKLGSGPRKLFDEIVSVWPKSISRDDLAARAGYESSGGTYGTYLSRLRSAELIVNVADGLRAVDELFPTGKLNVNDRRD